MEVDGRRVGVGEGESRFPGYFGFGTCSLVLGRNGAGKTHLLLSMADALTHGSGVEGYARVTYRDSSGGRRESSALRGELGVGVVYFSPIPFRRSIRAHPRFVDASRLKRRNVENKMVERHRWIAASLGVETRLVCRISYRNDLIQRLVVPVLMTENCELYDSSLEAARQEIMFVSGGNSPGDSERLIEKFSFDLERTVDGIIGAEGDAQLLVALATLEFLSISSSRRKQVAMAFLERWQVARFTWSSSDIASVMHEYDEVQRDTLRFMLNGDRARNLDGGSRFGVEFEVKVDADRRRLEGSRAAISMSWSNLSSGMMSLVDQFSRIDLALLRVSKKSIGNVVLLIDEGDVYLHLEWQRRYIEHLDEFLCACKVKYSIDSIQVVLATHSPLISGDFPSCMVTNLDANSGIKSKTFANSMDSVILEAFGTDSIGAFAAGKINEVYSRSKTNSLSEMDLRLINEIGDESLRRAVLMGERW